MNQGASSRNRKLLTMAVTLLVAVLVWWLQSPSGEDSAGTANNANNRAAATATPTGGAGDPSDGPVTPKTGSVPSGFDTVDLDSLPDQARDTLALIDAGGPYPYHQDGQTFQNREGILPDRPRGYYREFTVQTPGSPDRGARRLVAGEDGTIFYTDDHYESFRVVRR